MVEKVNEAHIKPIEEVSDGIREKLTVNRSEQLAYEAAEDTFDKALMDEDFEKAAADLGLTLHSTVYFTSNGSDLEISNPKVFASEAFKLIDLDISDILDIDGKYYIMQKIDELPSQIPDLADVENQVKADLFAKMQDEQARKSAEEFLVVCKETGGLEDAAKEMNVDVFSSGFFKRSESIPGIGYESNIIQAAFTLSDDSKTADSVFPTNSGYYVIQFGGRKSPGTDEIDTQKDTIKEQLISQKKQIIIKDWIDKMRSESEIEKEDRFLD
jgi:peptidyl-prolyl cis-trans isomerase D